MLISYSEQFNAWAKTAGLPDRIGLGVPGPLWRNDLGYPLSYKAWSRHLKQACVDAGVPVYTSHAFRRAFATMTSFSLPRLTVAAVGNWSSPRLMDDHYIQPSLTRLRSRLARLPSRPEEKLPSEHDLLILQLVGSKP
jgi:hypothetical protein